MLKAKLKAAGTHALLTSFIASVSAALVFGIWYPGELAKMLRGASLFWLVLGVELALGPLISLVIYNPLKSRAELIRDYSIVGCIQVAALAYGLYVVAASRPVYLVFVKDRLEVVTAIELANSDLEVAAPEYRNLPLFGPKLLCTNIPEDAKEKTALLMSALEGKDIQLLPKYYRPCAEGEISAQAQSDRRLIEYVDSHFPSLARELPHDNFLWMPVVTRFGYWTVVFERGEITQRKFIDLDPFEV